MHEKLFILKFSSFHRELVNSSLFIFIKIKKILEKNMFFNMIEICIITNEIV